MSCPLGIHGGRRGEGRSGAENGPSHGQAEGQSVTQRRRSHSDRTHWLTSRMYRRLSKAARGNRSHANAAHLSRTDVYSSVSPALRKPSISRASSAMKIGLLDQFSCAHLRTV